MKNSNRYERLQEKKYENIDYWNMMDITKGMDPVVTKLTEVMSSGFIFEFGT